MPSANGTNGTNGRDPKTGQFLKGWKGGPGNPHAQKVAHFRSLILDATTDEDILAVWGRLVEEAKDGKPWAVKELWERLFGKAKATVEVQQKEAPGDPFDLLRDREVTDALDRALRRRSARAPMAEPGSSRN